MEKTYTEEFFLLKVILKSAFLKSLAEIVNVQISL